MINIFGMNAGFMKIFIKLIDDFQFYQFHTIKYPNFVD